MKIPGWLGKVAKILGKLTDVLVMGRQAGLWNKKPGIQPPQLFAAQAAEVLPVSNGMSHTLAGLWTAFVTIAVAASQGLDWSILFTDPKRFASVFLAAFFAALGLYLQRPGQASVMLGSSKALREEAEVFDHLKIEVPIRPDGGK